MKQQTRRTIEELNLIDDFLFFEAVAGEKGEQLCRLLIRAVCGREVNNVLIHPQNVIQGIDTNYHGIRMDLYVDEDGQCLYDFEPDIHTSSNVLPKRNRYYRALLDARLLDPGVDFKKLPDMWTVFIMPKDPFHKNRMCYTVKNRIMEEPDLPYEDGAVSLFLYTKGRAEGNEELAQLLAYIEKSTEENAVTRELEELHEYVVSLKKRKEVGVRYMKSWELERMWREEAREEGLAEGRAEGRVEGLAEGRAEGLAEGRVEGLAEGRVEGLAEGKIEDILELLEEVGTVPESLSEKISQERDIETLSQWVRLAAKAESFADFEERI